MISSHRITILLAVMLLLASLLVTACSSDDGTPVGTPGITPAETVQPTPTPTEEIPSWTGDPTVQTRYGAVKAIADQSDTWVWKAIPYARPPVSELRWKAPRDPEPWEGVREKNKFCDMCPQYDPISMEAVIGNEDCLYLNVWRPQTEETGLPVYVWIHGGGNSIGAANQSPTYYGAALASKSNMVYVSMNYRLGPLGWFTHPALRTGDPLDDSGNYGTLDIIKSLEWIQDNIEAFGGDPNQVIITGESAGAVNIFSLIISPEAKGLFHSALLQSGMLAAMDVEYGEESARNALLALLVNEGLASDPQEAENQLRNMSDAEIEAYLRDRTSKEIFDCYEQKGFGMVDSPFIFTDGTVIAANGFETLADGTYPNKVPIMIGSNKEELKMFLFMNPAFEGKDELYQTVTSYGSDLWKINGVDDVTRKLSVVPDQPDIYAYQFKWGAGWDTGTSPIPPPYDLKLGSAHSLDVPFFLGNPSFNVIMTDWVFTEENRPGREALTDAMMAYVAQFARTGDPNRPGSGLPRWEPWTSETGGPKCLLFDADLEKAIIEMSTEELTITGVIDKMKAEVPESLYSEAIEFIQNEWTVSHLLEGVDTGYDPSPTSGPTPEPPETVEPEISPEPTPPAGDTTMIYVYNVRYDNEDKAEETVWTMTQAGEETVDNIACYRTEISFDQSPRRVRYVDPYGNIPLTVTSMATWVDQESSRPVRAESDTSAAGFNVTSATTFTYDSPPSLPLEAGQAWSYTEESTSMGMTLTSEFDVEVVGIEEVTVPAGTFNCYKVVHTDSSGLTNTEWRAVDSEINLIVKMVDESHWNGIETRELVSWGGTS